MKDKFPVIKYMTKGDFFLIFGIIILAGVLFLKPLLSDENVYAEIYLDSQKVHTVSFTVVKQDYVLNVGVCVLLVEIDGICFLS